MNLKRPTVSPLWLAGAASIWIATLANLPLWRELQSLGLLNTIPDGLFALALATIISCVLTAILSLLAWRWTLKPAIFILLAMSAAAAYFMWTYHIVIDSDMVVNMLQTDVKEAGALWNSRLLGTIFLLAVVPAIGVAKVRVARAPLLRQCLRNFGTASAAIALIATTVLVAFQPFASTMRNHKQLRYLMNPLNTVYALGYVASKPLRQGKSVLEGIGADAVAPAPGERPPLLVLVIGETARSANFSLNGYARTTNPELAREDIASFRNAVSCGTSTAASLPCMFSSLGRERYNARPHDYENLLDVLHRSGLAVMWIDNQSGCKGVCDRVPSASTAELTDSELCHKGECLDAIMLKGLDERLAELPQDRRKRGVVLVMHQMGSHGPAYYQRSPAGAKTFGPECTSNNLQECTSSELINAYDNSIVYTDQVLGSLISWLKSQQTKFDPAMVYVSDHGESLGENNLYLHGLPYGIAPDNQKRIPWITWLSPAFAQRAAIDFSCVKKRKDIAVSHDNYFHSVLGLLQVRTKIYEGAQDVYAPCVSQAEMASRFDSLAVSSRDAVER